MQPRPQILFDVVTKTVAILFEGNVITLMGPYSSRTSAMTAAMDECAKRGWLDVSHPALAGQTRLD
ncbi:hypothetical protein D0Y60_16115 [Shinella sp. WSJ-2]|nr:hypothetical protein D0Y60_16115 [Shinella sp. WSJ-2]